MWWRIDQVRWMISARVRGAHVRLVRLMRNEKKREEATGTKKLAGEDQQRIADSINRVSLGGCLAKGPRIVDP
eukprot:9467905-Pyramimonas_sp.AAC.1